MFDPDPELNRLLQKLVHPGLKVIDPALTRIHRLLAALDNPQKKLPPVIHVAGTNGKGSLVAFLRAIFKAAGYRAHAYTSPHLVRFNERIRIVDQPIATQNLMPLLERILAMQEEYPATFFEATTAAALLAFQEHPADIVILETGMGGRLDATNVIDFPAVTAITPIAMDHAEFLGDSLEKIAAEKAAIIKPEVPCVVGPQLSEAMQVISRMASEKNAPLFYPEMDWIYPPPALPGMHQIQNAATALAVMACLKDFSISPDHIRQGLALVDWPARLQPLTRGYWRNLLPGDSWSLYLDGGHNPHAAWAITGWVRDQQKPVYLVLGMLQDKDLRGYLTPWRGLARQIHAVPIPQEGKCYKTDEVVRISRESSFSARAHDTVERALAALAGQEPGLVMIAGSLYLAGHVLAKN